MTLEFYSHKAFFGIEAPIFSQRCYCTTMKIFILKLSLLYFNPESVKTEIVNFTRSENQKKSEHKV